MEAKFLHFLSLTSSIFILSAAFTPQDNYLISCGSNADSITVDNRRFVGDASRTGSTHLSEGKKSRSLSNPRFSENPSPNYPAIYSSARIFTGPFTYKFTINNIGTHLLRLHFSPFVSEDYDLKAAKFSVLANGFSLLSGFSSNSTVLKEFFLMVERDELELMFSPVGYSDFAYINAIEVFSAPKDFFIDSGGIALINPDGVQEFKQNITEQVFETIHRINVGGSKITPFNDTLWRTWVPDDDFLVLKSAARIAKTTDPPNYQEGGATRENAPDNVYMTAQQMNVVNRSLIFEFNVSWDFPVSEDDELHFVRLHFCDIVSVALNTLYFDVFINDVTAYKDLDLSVLAFHRLASPYYMDYVVRKAKKSSLVRITVGPSHLSTTLAKNAILNGVEIMRMVNFVPFRQTKSESRRSKWILVGSIVGGALALALIIILSATLVVLVLKWKGKTSPKSKRTESGGWTSVRAHNASSRGGPPSEGTMLASPGPYGYYGLKIPFTDLQTGTNNFDPSLVIGSGGFGLVYKAIIGEKNVKVAVKRGVPGSRQGLPEFQTEITVLSKIRHHHLVSLVGYCEEQSEMILVYEYMERGALKHHLYGDSDFTPLSWKQRLEICIGAARGVHYLHTGSAHGIIHRDIKSANILLDENYVAKVADFGLSKSGPCMDETHVSTGVKGSFGYLDPEYFRRRQLTDKSDVYSFGVVLFEVLCARPAVDSLRAREQVNLGEWALEWQRKGMVEQIVDRSITGQVRPGSLKIFVETAEKCLAEYGVDRPSMGDVLWNLEHAYRVQMGQGDCDSNGPVVFENGPTGRAREEEEGEEVGSDISTSRVFSQLLNNEGR
ncbi:Probable receptor-like protein kinase [Striga hermonthica]|uniref:Probable receptor-like protein kinase n=1 Tax=Striga hermonthica TaxID=68872 RepID=A0A9N7NL57_STRHE|nr:Probable receptor-like protein kinase [Striga hermonthica]